MSHRWLINLALLGITLILVAVMLYEPPAEQRKQPELTDINANEITKLRIERRAKGSFELEKNAEGGWQFSHTSEAAIGLPANNFHLQHILKILSAREYEYLPYPEISLNWDNFALNPASSLEAGRPFATLECGNTKIMIGEESPFQDGRRYMRIDDRLYLINGMIYTVLNQEPTQFASLYLLGENSEIKEIELPNYHFELKETGWRAKEAPADTDIGQDAIVELVEQWRQVQAVRVKPYQNNEVETQAANQIRVRVRNKSFNNDEKDITFLMLTSNSSNSFILALPEKKVQYQMPYYQKNALLSLPRKVASAEGHK